MLRIDSTYNYNPSHRVGLDYHVLPEVIAQHGLRRLSIIAGRA